MVKRGLLDGKKFMKTKNNAIKLKEITPEKLEEISQQLQNVRLMDLTLNSLKKVAVQRDEALKTLKNIELDAQIRSLRAYGLGFSKKDLANIFNVTTRQIGKWVGE
jgi:DNA-binding transcriptional regulator YiaG